MRVLAAAWRPRSPAGAADRFTADAEALLGFVADAGERGWRVCTPDATDGDAAGIGAADSVALLAAAARGDTDAMFVDLRHLASTAPGVDPAGELLQRLRAVVGATVPIVVALALDDAVSDRLLGIAGALAVSRTLPETDAWETGARAAALLSEIAARGPYITRWRRLAFPMAPSARSTRDEPAASLASDLQSLELQSSVRLGMAFGSPIADVADRRGPLVFGHGRDADVVDANVRALAENAAALRDDFELAARASAGIDQGIAREP